MLPFEAEDKDAGIYGDVNFSLTSSNDDHTYFAMRKLNRKQSQLVLNKIIEGRTYTVRFNNKISTDFFEKIIIFILDKRCGN